RGCGRSGTGSASPTPSSGGARGNPRSSSPKACRSCGPASWPRGRAPVRPGGARGFRSRRASAAMYRVTLRAAMPEQKRQSERTAVTLKVDYKRINTFFADYTRNISKGGTFIKTSKPLAIGTEFVFVLSLPSQHEQLNLHGEVVWIVDEHEASDQKPAGMGIR